MPFVSLTRLRIRHFWFLPRFAVYAVQTRNQVQRAAGFLEGGLLPDRKWTFWTMTAWDSEASMRSYMLSGAHKRAMPKLMDWCDEASVAHWEQEGAELPDWVEADRRMRTTGRVSKVRYPSPQHAGLQYREPRTTGATSIPPRV